MVARVTRSKAEARATYDRLSRWYDLLAGSSERKYVQAGLHDLGVQPGEVVLEAGCGTGQALLDLAQAAGPGGRVYGIDLSPHMLRLARERVQKAGCAGQVQLNCGDAAHLPYPADCFDAVFMSFTLELFDTPEIPLVLGECRRVLHPGGRLGLVAMAKGRGNLAVRTYEWAHQRFPKALDCRPIYVGAAVNEAGFVLQSRHEFSMWGLPGEMVRGVKI